MPKTVTESHLIQFYLLQVFSSVMNELFSLIIMQILVFCLRISSATLNLY